MEPLHWTRFQPGGMGFLNLCYPAVSGKCGHHFDPHLLKEGLDGPQVSGNVVLSKQVYGAGAGWPVSFHADELKEGIASGLVALILVSAKAFRLNWYDGQVRAPGETSRQTAFRSSPMIPTMQVE